MDLETLEAASNRIMCVVDLPFQRHEDNALAFAM